MTYTLQPWQFLFAVFCGWVHQRQTLIIEFQNDQITTMMEALGKKRLLLTDNQRRLLAVKGKAIGRKALLQLTTIVTPDTILGWHRKLVAEKWDYSEKRKSVGRPRTSQEIVDLIRAVCHHILEFSARVLATFRCGNLRFGEISVEFPLGSRERRM